MVDVNGSEEGDEVEEGRRIRGRLRGRCPHSSRWWSGSWWYLVVQRTSGEPSGGGQCRGSRQNREDMTRIDRLDDDDQEELLHATGSPDRSRT